MSATFIVIASLLSIPMLVWLAMWISRPVADVIDEPSDPAISATAWVFGGPFRVCQTWWVELHRQGVLSVDPDGRARVNVTATMPLQDDRWLRQALANIPSNTPLTRREIMRRWQPALEALRADLVSRRMLAPTAHLMMVVVYRLIALAGIGLTVWVAFTPNTGIAWMGVLLATFSWIIAIRVLGIPRLTTGAIDWKNKQSRAAQAALRAPQDNSMALAVAVGGTVVLMGTPYAAHASGVQRSDGSGGGGCGTAASAGSGCGNPSDAGGGFDTGGGFGGGDSATGGDGGSGCGGGGCGGCGS